MKAESVAALLRDFASALNNLAFAVVEPNAPHAVLASGQPDSSRETEELPGASANSPGFLIPILERLLRRLGISSSVGQELIVTILRLIFEARDEAQKGK